MAEGELIIDTAGVGAESTIRAAHPFQSGVLLRLKEPATFTVEVGGVAVLTISNEQGAVRIDLGDAAAERLVLGDSFRAFLNDFLAARFDAHVHPVSGQTTGAPLAAFTGAQMPESLLTTAVRGR